MRHIDTMAATTRRTRDGGKRGKTPGTQVQHDQGSANGTAEIRHRCGCRYRNNV